ncbi:RICIN domain-containing protein [Streptomyces sp. NRRL S-474]|uniref:RICIN domain-containing protein n=1 Tax=Streptomyces sp. NRRL S-474 TaxID=1463909 RepID=UPI0004C91370|nr:RICIN domain-containing protein [Streptomyces sp. NRRL S-474]
MEPSISVPSGCATSKTPSHLHQHRRPTQVASGTWACNQTLKVAEWPARNVGFVRHSGKAADVERGGTANGTDVLQWPCLNKANEKWTFSKTGDG